MGTVRQPKPAKYFVALLSPSPELLTSVETDLAAVLGEIDGRSEIIPWTVSKFYEKEMGASLLRRFLSFLVLASPENLAAVKHQAQRIEEQYRGHGLGGRQVNLDPGYIDVYKVVLASTKNACQRIVLHSGIYGEATLFYYDGRFHGLDYTYRDYLWPETLAFLTKVREAYLGQLKQLG